MINDKIAKAIRTLDNTKEYSHIVGDIDSIVWLNGSTPIEKSVIEAKIAEMETAKANEETQKETKKASGKQKLLDLGLTEEEVKALIGA